jgi:hypothetical protein
MSDPANSEGFKNWGTGPSSARPDSVGPHDVNEGQFDPDAKPMDPSKDYNGQPGDNKGLGIKDGPGGPVSIQVKGGDEPEKVPETNKPRTGG